MSLQDLDPQNLGAEERNEYYQFIKESVKDGSYFKDAFSWYIFRYVTPICERTILFFGVLFTSFIIYNLTITIKDALPIKEQIPIVLTGVDLSLYFPVIKKLKDSSDLKTVDEAVAKYLLINYLKDREEYDFRKPDIQELNKKFTHIKNNSSPQEYDSFQQLINKNDPNGLIVNFGRNATRAVEIQSVVFENMEDDSLIAKAKDFIIANIPSKAEIIYNATVSYSGVSTTEKYLAKIYFRFSGTGKEINIGNKKKIDFLIVDYQTYKIK